MNRNTILGKRLPPLSELAPVFAVIAFLAYGRMFYIFSFKLPAWLTFLTTGEIATILAYGLVVNLLESLVVLLAVLLISFILPPRWFRDYFVPRAAWLVAFVLGSAILYFQRYASIDPSFIDLLYLWCSVTLLLSIPVTFFGGRVPFLRTVATVVADRLIVFLYILIPASLLSAIVIAARNLS
jgi:hypothetical protein